MDKVTLTMTTSNGVDRDTKRPYVTYLATDPDGTQYYVVGSCKNFDEQDADMTDFAVEFMTMDYQLLDIPYDAVLFNEVELKCWEYFSDLYSTISFDRRFSSGR